MRTLLLLSVMAFCAGVAPAQDFERIFGDRYANAVSYVRDHAGAWRARLAPLGVDSSLLVPVVFPEILRFSLLRSEAERLGLATLYVAGGARAADFSVGVFQMKPSFVERLEEDVATLPGAPMATRDVLSFPGADTEWARRVERLRRLQDVEWQVLYLGCFDLVVEHRCPLAGLERDARVRFLSAAYNGDFHATRERIEASEALRLYPNGRRLGLPAPYRYGDVAVDFFHRYGWLLAP